MAQRIVIDPVTRIEGHAKISIFMDDAGNVYWTESETSVIRSYRADTNRVVTVAGSIRGLADGPLARARFGGWFDRRIRFRDRAG